MITYSYQYKHLHKVYLPGGKTSLEHRKVQSCSLSSSAVKNSFAKRSLHLINSSKNNEKNIKTFSVFCHNVYVRNWLTFTLQNKLELKKNIFTLKRIRQNLEFLTCITLCNNMQCVSVGLLVGWLQKNVTLLRKT